MNTGQATKFVSYCFDGDYSEDELEIAHLATIQVIGSKIEEMLKPGMELNDALGAFMNTGSKDAQMLRTAVQNAVKEE